MFAWFLFYVLPWDVWTVKPILALVLIQNTSPPASCLDVVCFFYLFIILIVAMKNHIRLCLPYVWDFMFFLDLYELCTSCTKKNTPSCLVYSFPSLWTWPLRCVVFSPCIDYLNICNIFVRFSHQASRQIHQLPPTWCCCWERSHCLSLV